MKKTDKNMIIGVAVAAVVLIIVVIAVLIVKGNGDSIDGDIEAGGGSQTEQIENNTKEADFSQVDVTVGYGDYDVMFAQSKAIQNGEMLGEVVQVDGIVSHPISNYSIGQKDENGSFVGTVFVIEGAEEEDYPEDGDHVVVTGEIVEKSPMYFVIRTTPQYVTVLEKADEVEADD